MFGTLLKTFITTAILQPEEFPPTLFAEDLSGNAFQIHAGILLADSLLFSYALNLLNTTVSNLFSGPARRFLITVPILNGNQVALLSTSLFSLVITFIIYPSIVIDRNRRHFRLNSSITVMKTIYNKQGLLGFYVGYGNFVARCFYNLFFQLIIFRS